MSLRVRAVFHPPSHTFCYVAWDPESRYAAIIDPVLDYDASSGRTATDTAEQILAIVQEEQLCVEWLLETHAHADHISAVPFLKTHFDAPVAIGERIVEVQQRFAKLFNLEADFQTDGSQFDHLFADRETFSVGSIPAQVFHTPGHTSDHITYVIGDAVFCGDTLFMPDAGTARCDFPAGSAQALYRSIHQIFDTLPDSHRVFVLHDYGTDDRNPAFMSSIGEQRLSNIHVGAGVSESQFVAMREARDATLPMPALILPAVQLNIRAGQLPPPEENGLWYVKIPLNEFGPYYGVAKD